MDTRKKILMTVLSVFGLCVGSVGGVWGDQLRYMDEAGNIRFVNRMKEVPREYREQIIPPTPAPVLDERQRAALKRKQQEEQVRRERDLAKRQRDEKQRREELERHRRKLEKESLQLSGLDRVQRLGR